MEGKIEKIWENEKNGKKYWVLAIGGDRYSVWDEKYIHGLSEGAVVDYKWRQSGNFRKITDLRKIDPEPEIDPYKRDRKSIEIVRMSCLKSASEILNGLFIDPDKKVKKALEISREFEKIEENCCNSSFCFTYTFPNNNPIQVTAKTPFPSRFSARM